MTSSSECGYSSDPLPANQKIVEESLKPPRRKTRSTVLKRLAHWLSPYKAIKELCDPLFWHDVIIETLLCVFYNCSVVWVGITLNKNIYQPGILHFGLYAGFFVFLCIEGWGPICGASINISRTLAVFLCGRMTPIKSLIYFIVEIGGGAAGAMLAYALTPEKYYDLFYAIVPADGMSDFQAMIIEAILTANLIIVGLVVTDPKLKPMSVMGSFPVGFSVATGILAAGTHSGGLQNPVVAMTYAMLGKNFNHHWPYWAGPLLGSALATLFYMLMEQLRDRYGPYNPPKEEPQIDATLDIDNNNNDKTSQNSYDEKTNGTRRRVTMISLT